jgi:sugar transferase (PEP-CTERM system associated)
MWRVFSRYVEFRRLGAVVLENILLVCCILDAAQIRLGASYASSGAYQWFIAKAFLIAVVFQLNLHFRDVYDFRKTASFPQFLSRLVQALIMASAAISLLFYAFPDLFVGRGVFAISLILVSIFLTIWHTLLRIYFGVRAPRSKIVILGTGQLARELVTEILRKPEMGMGVAGFVDDNPALVGVSVVNPKVLGLTRDLEQIVLAHDVDRVIVELKDRRGRLPIQTLLNMKTRGIAIEDATSFYERVAGKIAIENLKPSWMIFNPGFEVSAGKLLQKRIFSLLISAVLLTLSAPIVLIVMAIIKLDSRGPVFFGQERVGQDGEVFKLWKFRSMRENAEEETGPVWASLDDPRVTRVGRLLRRMRLDELPQLFNVLKGDMSLVGPRPERPHFVSELAEQIPFYHLRHAVKPGVTGWAQISYHYGNSLKDAIEKLQYDLFYIKNMSWLLDTLIVFQTIKIVLFQRGS